MQTCNHDVISAESISTLQWAGILDFVLLPLPYLLVIFGVVAIYFMSAELTKRWFYRQVKPWMIREITHHP